MTHPQIERIIRETLIEMFINNPTKQGSLEQTVNKEQFDIGKKKTPPFLLSKFSRTFIVSLTIFCDCVQNECSISWFFQHNHSEGVYIYVHNQRVCLSVYLSVSPLYGTSL